MSLSAPRPVAVFDIDGTIIRSSLVIELTHALIAAGIFPEEVRQEFAKEETTWRNRQGSYHEYIDALVRVYNHHATGKNAADITEVAIAVARQQHLQTYRYTRELIEQIRDTHYLVAISGSPTEVIAPFAQAHGFHHAHGTTKHQKNGVYIDTVDVGSHHKHRTLQSLIKEHHLTLTDSIGVGDTESDISFLELLARPIAFNPNQELFKAATSRGWSIVLERKDMIYELNAGPDNTYILETT